MNLENDMKEKVIQEYQMEDADRFLRWEGRILKKQGICYLGYTNSSITMQITGSALWLHCLTGENEEICQPGLRIYVDGVRVSEIVLDKRDSWYQMCSLEEGKLHCVKIVKITEAAMSYAGIAGIRIASGRLEEQKEEKDNRTKVEFIGDSITCGYGVHGKPQSEFTIREEDGENCYAAFMAAKMNWNARWIAASGYGMFVEYTGNPDNNVPKLYPYVNWFLDKEQKIERDEFEPEYIFVNLGTNDSGHLHRQEIRTGFINAYEEFLKLLRKYHPDSVIVCLLGTVCENVFPYIEQVIAKLRQEGFCNVYACELPYHNVREDGMASNHPSIKTHKKDADRILQFMETQGILQRQDRNGGIK